MASSVVTTDKVYENNEDGRAFKEGDRLGGHDPYSASKAAAEIAIGPYRRSDLMGLRAAPVTSVRAGNVIGGGDWSADRLIPDIVRALEAGENITLRRPDAVRPWQHVLDCVHGYLLVAASQLAERPLSPAYNFAHEGGAATVLEVTSAAVKHWGASDDRIVIERETDAQEAGLLTLDPSLAHEELGWNPAWTLDESIAETIRIYRDPSQGAAQIEDHMERTKAPVRIALLSPYVWPEVRRGGERYLDDLAWYFRGAGHDVDVITGTASDAGCDAHRARRRRAPQAATRVFTWPRPADGDRDVRCPRRCRNCCGAVTTWCTRWCRPPRSSAAAARQTRRVHVARLPDARAAGEQTGEGPRAARRDAHGRAR